MVGTKSARGAELSTGVQVTGASGREDSGARLSRLFDSPLGSCDGRLQVGSYLGHDLLGAADVRLPAAFAAGATLAGFGSGRWPDGDLVSGDLLINGDGHGHLQSVGDGRTYPLGKPIAKLPAQGGMRSVAVALVRPRQSAVPIAVLAGCGAAPWQLPRSVSDGGSAVRLGTAANRCHPGSVGLPRQGRVNVQATGRAPVT
jgi:hypothetical protein